MDDINKMELEDVRLALEADGVTFHPNMGLTKLRKLLTASRNSKEVAKEIIKDKATKKLSKVERNKIKKKLAMRLRRIKVSPNTALLSKYPGQIFSVCCSAIDKGKAIKKYVPFNNEAGWHVPNIIYEHIKAATMQVFVDQIINGKKTSVGKIVKKYNVELLPELSKDEIKKIADMQASRGDV